jgi:cell division protein FtsB
MNYRQAFWYKIFYTVLRWTYNRYVLTLVAALIWVVFFDQFNLRSQFRMQEHISQLEQEKEFYRTAIVSVKGQLHALKTDKQALERLARERYLMKRDNEDLYIIVDPKAERKAPTTVSQPLHP